MHGYVQAVSRKLSRMLVMNSIYLYVSFLGSIVSYQRESLTLAESHYLKELKAAIQCLGIKPKAINK